jgi:hypothetical protein
VTTIKFERDDQGIISFGARLEGPLGSRELQLALDTSAAMTLVLPGILDEFGYSARDGDGITSISTANEVPEHGYKLRVRHFHCPGGCFLVMKIDGASPKAVSAHSSGFVE